MASAGSCDCRRGKRSVTRPLARERPAACGYRLLELFGGDQAAVEQLVGTLELILALTDTDSPIMVFGDGSGLSAQIVTRPTGNNASSRPATNSRQRQKFTVPLVPQFDVAATTEIQTNY